MASSMIDKALQQVLKDSEKKKVLWRNAAPASGFGKQAIPINDLQKYTNVEVIGTYNQVTNRPDCSIICETTVGESAAIQSAQGAMQYRVFTIGTNEIEFESGNYLATYRGSAEVTINACVPLVIYGIKILTGGGYRLATTLLNLLFAERRCAVCL